MLQLFTRMGGVAVMGMAVAVTTAAMAAAYAIRPTEQRLALMRPLSLATIFAALFAFFSGLSMIFQGIAATSGPIAWDRAAAGAAESLAMLVGAFGSLAVAWVLVAIGLRRH